MDDYDLLVLAGGAELPRDLDVPGRDLEGVHFAMDFLSQQNRRVAGDEEARAAPKGSISATGKHVVVIGGGDTGSDCIGTSHRQGALSVTQLEIMPEPPLKENKALSWPHWPMKLRTSSSQEEGAAREFDVVTERLLGEDGRVTALLARRGDEPLAIRADLVLLAMGFLGPRSQGLVEQVGVALAGRGTVATNLDFRTSKDRIYACGDARRGQSLVVWAIREGRECAAAIDRQLRSAYPEASGTKQ
jgi:glutamate synthase (NADPH/NADH) small chain